jgi:hypothetical protein
VKKQLHRMLAIAVFGLFAACVSEVPASAQEVFGGSFTLPHEVRWNRTVLPAGSYTFLFSTAPMPNRMIVMGPNGFEFDLSSATSYGKTDQPSALTLERRGGTSFVRELYLADLGLYLRYDVLKAKDAKELAQGPASTEKLLIATGK